MADLSDVTNALAAVLAGQFYPNGTSQPSVIGDDIVVFPGWPESACLTSQMQAGNKIQVSVYPVAGEKNVTRFDEKLREMSRGTKTLLATVAGNQVTLSGTVATPQNVAIFVNGKTVAYGLQSSDSLNSVAAALATLISNAGIAASSAGAVLTVAGAVGNVRCGVGVAGELYIEHKRQVKQFLVTVWAPTPDKRVAAAKVIDPALARLHYLTLADNTHARLIYVRSDDNDRDQEILVYRRDIVYAAEYATIEIVGGTEVVVVEESFVPSFGAADERRAPATEVNTGGQ